MVHNGLIIFFWQCCAGRYQEEKQSGELTHSNETFPLLSVSNCLIAVLTSSVLRSDPTVMSKSCSQNEQSGADVSGAQVGNKYMPCFFCAIGQNCTLQEKEGRKRKEGTQAARPTCVFPA